MPKTVSRSRHLVSQNHKTEQLNLRCSEWLAQTECSTDRNCAVIESLGRLIGVSQYRAPSRAVPSDGERNLHVVSVGIIPAEQKSHIQLCPRLLSRSCPFETRSDSHHAYRYNWFVAGNLSFPVPIARARP